MKGRQKGRPTKWVYASVEQWFYVDKSGFRFEVWEKWKKSSKKVGTLTVSVGGLRWLPPKGKVPHRQNWLNVSKWLTGQ